jgi:parvulin-like peptidyl-prolyl isomerase
MLYQRIKKVGLICLSMQAIVFWGGDSLFARELVDKIVARVNGVNILKSDIEQRRISKSGQPFTLKELVTEELYVQKAVERNMWPKETEIRKQIVNLKIHNGISHLTDEEFKSELEQEGFTIKEYEYQLGRMLAGEKLKQAEFNERVVVTKQEVESYHKNNPEKVEEKYLIAMCELTEKDIDKSGNLIKKKDFCWDEMGWIEKPSLDKRLLFVSSMQKGAVSKPLKIGSKYHIVKLEDKMGARERSLKERYTDIERILQNEKKIKFEQEFEKELKKNSFVVYLDKKSN